MILRAAIRNSISHIYPFIIFSDHQPALNQVGILITSERTMSYSSSSGSYSLSKISPKLLRKICMLLFFNSEVNLKGESFMGEK